MATKKQIDAYRRRLSKIDTGSKLTAECVGAVFYGGIEAPMSADQEVGTILGVEHEQGWGLFGPTIWTRVKLCPACVHKRGGDHCVKPDAAEWRTVLWVDEIRRNGDPMDDNLNIDGGEAE
jgi:hypothetical protein